MTARSPLFRRSIIAGVVALAVGVPAVCATTAALADTPVSGAMKIYSSSTWYASGEFVLKNSSSEAQDWSLSFRVPAGTFQNNASWNTDAKVDGDRVTLTPKQDLAAGATANISFGIAGQGTDALDIIGCDLSGHGVEGCTVDNGEGEGDTEAPSFTGDLRVEATGPNAVDLAWAAASDNVGVTEYRVFVDGADKPVASVGASTLKATVDGLDPEKTYEFQVFAYDAAGNHGGSTVTTVTTPAKPGDDVDSEAPTSVERLDAEAVSPTSVKLDWSPASDNVGVHAYRIYEGDRLVTIVAAGINSATITGLTSETGYAFQVRANDKAGNEGGSRVAFVTTPSEQDTVAPSVPTGLGVHSTSKSDTLHVMWQHSTDNVEVAGYKVFRGGAQVADLPGTMRMTDISGLEADTEYGFQVLAYDASGNESAKTEVATGRTGAAEGSDTENPSNVVCIEAVATSATTVDVTWTPAIDNVGVASYKIYVGDKIAAATVDGKTTTTTLTGLTPDTQYAVSVHAYDAAGNHGVSVLTAVRTPEKSDEGSGISAPADFAATPSSYDDGGRTMHRVEMTWTPDQPIKRYEITLDGTQVQTLLVGSAQTAPQKRYLLLGQEPAASHTVQMRAQLADGRWTDYTAATTVQFTK